MHANKMNILDSACSSIRKLYGSRVLIFSLEVKKFRVCGLCGSQSVFLQMVADYCLVVVVSHEKVGVDKVV